MYDQMQSRAIGAHVFLFREGDAFLLPNPGGVAAIDALPDPLDDGWINAGDIESFDDSMAQDEEKETRKPNPGALVRKDIITIFQGLDFKFVTNSVPRIAIEGMYRTETILDDGQTQFVPLSLTPRKMWLKLQRYSHDNRLIFAADLWVRMKVSGGFKGGNGELIMPEYTCRLLDSDLNTMAFGELD